MSQKNSTPDEGSSKKAQKDTQGESRSTIDTGTLNPEAALLAEDENAFLGHIHEHEEHRLNQEIAQWIGSILGEELQPETIYEDLCSGVRLLHLAKSIQLIKCENIKDSEYNDIIRKLKADDVEFSKFQPQKRASSVARQRSNIAKFLDWCKYIGVPSIMLFESGDIASGKNLRQVATCILRVAKIAAQFGIEPPSSVKEEIEKEARLLSRKQEDIVKTPLVSKKQFIDTSPPIFEHEDEYSDTPTSTRHNYIMDLEGHYGRTSTPSSMDNSFRMQEMKPTFKSMDPLELQFEEQEIDAVIVETVNDAQKTKLHFEPKPYIEDVEITETQDMIIVDKMDDEVKEITQNHGITRFDDGLEDVNGNCDASTTITQTSDESSTTSENEYYTAHGTFYNNNDVMNLMYHTAYVDDVSDDDEDHEPLPKVDSAVYLPGATVTSSSDGIPTSPFMLRSIPADVALESDDVEHSSEDESVVDVESYTSDDDRNDVTYTDVGVGTDDFIVDDMKKVKEIMINFPPYFEISSSPKTVPVTRREFVVAPVRKETAYTDKTSPRGSRSTFTNVAYESETRVIETRDDSSLPRHQRRDYSVPRSLQPRSLTEQATTKNYNEKGTQTHVSLSDDIVRIISEMGDLQKIRTTTSSVPSSPRTPTSGNRNRTTVITAQLQKTLPTQDRNIAVIQATDLESGRPARYGSVTGAKYRSRDVEAQGAAMRRSMLSRASSAISEQFEKAAVVAKKYKKEISIILILLLLTAAALIAMAVVFPHT